MVRNAASIAADRATDEVAGLLLRWMSASMRSSQPTGMAESLRLLGELGATMPMTVALHVLAFAGPQTMTQLSEQLGLSPSATSHLLQRLVELDLAHREDDPDDRRRRLLAVTPRGRRAVDELMAARLAELRASLAPLSSATLSKLRGALVAVLDDLAGAARPVCPAPAAPLIASTRSPTAAVTGDRGPRRRSTRTASSVTVRSKRATPMQKTARTGSRSKPASPREKT